MKSMFFFKVFYTAAALLAAAGFCTGCRNYDFACDAGPVQLGCVFQDRFSPPEERHVFLRFGFPWWIRTAGPEEASTTVNGLILSPFLDIDSGQVNGIACSCVLLFGGEIRGLVLAPFGTLHHSSEGVSISILNWAVRHAWCQIGGMNLCLMPWENGHAGVQLGVLNWAGHAFFQCGLVNAVMEPDAPSVQLGLLNRMENALLFEWFPVMNVSLGRR